MFGQHCQARGRILGLICSGPGFGLGDFCRISFGPRCVWSQAQTQSYCRNRGACECCGLSTWLSMEVFWTIVIYILILMFFDSSNDTELFRLVLWVTTRTSAFLNWRSNCIKYINTVSNLRLHEVYMVWACWGLFIIIPRLNNFFSLFSRDLSHNHLLSSNWSIDLSVHTLQEV